MLKRILSVTLFSGLVALGAAVPTTANFETDQSGQFTVVTTSGDANANFNYDSSTHVQQNGPAITIGPAPGSATTKVLRLNANIADAAAVDAVNVYPTVTGLSSSWVMVYDGWQNYNGPALGGSGSTQMLLFGATNSTAIAPAALTTANISGDGFYFAISGEGGAAQDYRFYSGTGTITRNDAGALWFGGANYNQTATVWQDFFTTPTYETAGAMGKAWTTFRMFVNGTNATLQIKRANDTTFVDVATATVPATATMPFIGYSDINTGLPTTVSWTADQFVLVDNLLIDNVASKVEDWSVY